MKKITFLFLVLTTLVSCNKVKVTEIRCTTKVTLTYSMVTEVPMTKSVNQSTIATWITNNLPTNISFKLTDSKGTTFRVANGTEVELPCGSYTVTAKYTPVSEANVVGSNVFFSTLEPTIVVNTTLDVTYDRANYTVPASFGCFGIVYDLDEVSAATFVSSHGESGTLPTTTVGESAFVFMNGDLESAIVDVTLTPRQAGFKQTTYTFKSSYDLHCVTASFGNYYIIHPYAINSVDNGSLSYSVDSFTAVNVE